jgi:hypothetical protein
MKLLLPLALSISLLAGCAMKSANGSCSATAAATSQKHTSAFAAGNYSGQWTGADGATGKLKVDLKSPAGARWEAKVSFTFEGEEVPTTMKSVEVSGDRLRLTYGYDVRGNSGVVTMTGNQSGSSLEGTYQIEGAKGGTWKASLAQ